MSNTKTARPLNPGKPRFNLDAVEAEATGQPFEFDWHDESYSLPSAGDADWRALAALDSGKLEAGLRGLMGDDQYDRFASRPLATKKLGKLVEAYLEYQGVKPGELQASAGS